MVLRDLSLAVAVAVGQPTPTLRTVSHSHLSSLGSLIGQHKSGAGTICKPNGQVLKSSVSVAV